MNNLYKECARRPGIRGWVAAAIATIGISIILLLVITVWMDSIPERTDAQDSSQSFRSSAPPYIIINATAPIGKPEILNYKCTHVLYELLSKREDFL